MTTIDSASERVGQPSDAPLISLQEVTVGYGRQAVLSGISFDVHASEFWCFLGPNGEGKTTLIKAILGALRPKRGLIRRRPEMSRAERVSYVPQRLDLNPSLPTSVREFVLGGMVGLSIRSQIRRKRLDRVLELVGLKSSQRRNYWTLSGGQKQRALVARALIRDPGLLIVDEPIAGLDFAAAAAVLHVLRDLHETYDVTVVFVTHDLQIAADHATHLGFFHNGRVETGPIEEVLTPEALHRTFGVPTDVHRDGGRFRIGRAAAFSGKTPQNDRGVV